MKNTPVFSLKIKIFLIDGAAVIGTSGWWLALYTAPKYRKGQVPCPFLLISR
jgi:hypothetical protein